jgi:hypothetical protein
LPLPCLLHYPDFLFRPTWELLLVGNQCGNAEDAENARVRECASWEGKTREISSRAIDYMRCPKTLNGLNFLSLDSIPTRFMENLGGPVNLEQQLISKHTLTNDSA